MSTAPQITTPPASPNKYGGDPVAFDAAMQAFLDWMAAAAPQMNTQATWLNQRADTVDAGASAAGSIGASVSTAAASASAAASARDAAIAAWSASTAPTEQLSAISQSLHSGSIVKAIVYDTSKDSDGGAWRKRTARTSWYNEALGFTGKWLGQKASTATAWATSGAAAGDGFQNSTDGTYFVLTGTSTASEIFRGNVREFPAVAGIVAGTARVMIYDLTQPTCPMWMVFTSANFSNLLSGSFTSVAAVNGTILVGSSAGANFAGLAQFNFVADTATHHRNATYVADQRMASKAHPLTADYRGGVTLPALVNATVNDVAITVLETAPTDPATGLPVPTIYAFTAGGVSRIADDGTVSSTASTSVDRGWIDGAYVRVAKATGTSSLVGGWPIAKTLPAGGASPISTYLTNLAYDSGIASIPALKGYTTIQGAQGAVATASGITLLKENPSTPAKGMVVYVTNTYNSGWMVGDIRGAWLADTTAETVSASTALFDDFSSYADSAALNAAWTAGASVLTLVAGKARVTNAGGLKIMTRAITTVVGKTYTVTADCTLGTATYYLLFVGTTSGGAQLADANSPTAASGVLTFTATTTTSYLSLGSTVTATQYVDFDNISVKLAEPDRCVKNKGLIVNGSLTKTAVASGAGLVAYSGFNTGNYLEQPYNSDLDFGTGDFCVMGWVNLTDVTTAQALFDRGGSSSGRIALAVVSSLWYASASATSAGAVSLGVAATTGLSFVVFYRESGVLKLNVNATQVYSAANTANVSNATAKQVFGRDHAGASGLTGGSLALWRIGATAPSQSQIEHIYRTELALFQPGAQCTLAGTSTAVTTMAYDEDTTLLHVGTSWGRSSFKDLLRVDSEATTTGALTSLSAQGGVILTGGTSGKVYMPALLLRDELRRKAEARKALGKVPVFFDYTATASQTAFVAPKGYTIKALYHNGTLKREATTGVYWTRSNDGFAETATLSVGASASDWISLMCVRV